MKTSVIRQRVADFLKRHSPFDTLPEEDLLELAGSGKVKFHESEEYLYRRGDAKGPFVWTIQQGRVEILEDGPSGERLRDVLGAGDILGLERFQGSGSCLHSARTATDVILYGVAAPLFESLVARYPAVRRYLTAHFSVSGNLGFNRTSWLEAELPPLEFLRARLAVLPQGASSEDAASALAASRSGVAALVDDGGRLTGTITALDLCAAPALTAGAAARACASSFRWPHEDASEAKRTLPVAALKARPGRDRDAALSTRVAVREMLQSRGAPLAVTADGTAGGSLVAVLTAAELALFCGRDPAGLVGAIRQAASAAEIAPLLPLAAGLVRDGLAQPQDIDDCCRIGTAAMAALADACIQLAEREIQAVGIAPARVPHCWVLFAAAARGEVLAPGIPTIAAVYDDSHPAFEARDSIYFAALAGQTETTFHAFGFGAAGVDWPEGAGPSMPLSEWKRLYSETIRNPLGHDLYARRSFFDLCPLSGDTSIHRQLLDHIGLELRDHVKAIPLLAIDTMAHVPPLTFFRGLVVALDGAQSDSFDIADSVVSPLTNAARVLALAKRRVAPANTLERLETALLDFPEGAEALTQAADAFRIGLYYQTLVGSARIDPGKLGKFDQLLLKTAFSSIQHFLEFTVSTLIPDL